MDMQLFPVHRATHPGTATSVPFATDKQEPLHRADWHRNFVPWYLLYQSIKSQNSLQIQGVKPSTTGKPQQNLKSIFSFLLLSIQRLFLPSSMKGPYQSSGTRTPFLLVVGLFRSSSWKEMKPFPQVNINNINFKIQTVSCCCTSAANQAQVMPSVMDRTQQFLKNNHKFSSFGKSLQILCACLLSSHLPVIYM